MDNKKLLKTPSKFICEPCDFKCCKNIEYSRHISTSKHLKHSQGYKNDIKTPIKNSECEFKCDNCGNGYKFYSGLWRHKKMCDNLLVSVKEEPTDKELIMLLVKQNAQLIEKNAELLKNGTNNTTNNTTNTTTNNNNNSHNKTFNLQFFLNEKCKDAMNITDFVETIKIQLKDIMKLCEIGHVEEVSNIITTNLQALDVTQRPIHCTDKKREVLYIKDDNILETKNGNKYQDCKECDSKYSIKLIDHTIDGIDQK